MSLLSKFRNFQKNRHEKKIQKTKKLISNPKAIREDRQAALELAAHSLEKPEEAIPLLLARFEYSLEHGINDTREKELAMDGITRFKEDAIPFVKEHLKNTTRIAWPIKVLNALGKEEIVIETLKETLDFNDVSFDQTKVDKNYDILCYLRDYSLPNFYKQLAHFLKDPDERVRFAAIEILSGQNEKEIAPLIESFISDDRPENTRLKNAAIEAFLNKGWLLTKPEKFPDQRITNKIGITDKGKLFKV